MDIFRVLFTEPSLNLFYGVYLFTKDVGWAIIFMAFIVRAIMWPFIRDSYIVGQKTRKIQPLLKKAQQEHKGDIAGMQKVLNQIYTKYDVKPSFSGLIILIQIPIYIGLYNIISSVNNGDKINGFYTIFFGDTNNVSIDPLAFGALNISGSTSNGQGTVVYTLAIITMVLSFFMSKLIFSSSKNNKPTQPKKEKTNSLIDSEVFNRTLQMQMTYIMPVLSFVINANFPIGLNIYFLAGTLFSLIQQFILKKYYNLDITPIEEDFEIFPKSKEKSKKTSEELEDKPIEVDVNEKPESKNEQTETELNSSKSKENSKTSNLNKKTNKNSFKNKKSKKK